MSLYKRCQGAGLLGRFYALNPQPSTFNPQHSTLNQTPNPQTRQSPNLVKSDPKVHHEYLAREEHRASSYRSAMTHNTLCLRPR